MGHLITGLTVSMYNEFKWQGKKDSRHHRVSYNLNVSFISHVHKFWV
jgi:hypothetical protein